MKLAVFIALLFCFAFSEKLLMVGGGLDDANAEIYNAFIDLSSENGSPYLGIITCASGEDAETNGKEYVDLLQKTYKVQNVKWIPIDLDHLDNAYDQKIVDDIKQMTGIFFGGGDQSRLVTCFYTKDRKDTPALAAIRENLEKGVLAVAGSSAGTTIQQKAPMVTGGESYYALLYGSFDHIDDKHPDDLSYDKQGGFGFYDYGYLDTHFACRGRQGRMIRLIADTSKKSGELMKGAGIDENTAIKIVNGVGTVIGESGVYFFDVSNAKVSDGSQYSVANVRVHYLTEGDSINMKDFSKVNFASYKKNIKGREQHDYPLSASYDIFSSPDAESVHIENIDNDRKLYGIIQDRLHSQEFTIISTDLFNCDKADSTIGYTYETNPEFIVDFKKDNQSVGYVGSVGKTQYISYTNLRVDITYSRSMDSVDLE